MFKSTWWTPWNWFWGWLSCCWNVDDQSESCEVTTNFRDSNEEDEETTDITNGASIQDILEFPKTIQIPENALFHQMTPKADDSGIFFCFSIN